MKKIHQQNQIIFVYNLELTVTAQARKYDELGKHLKLDYRNPKKNTKLV